MYCKNCGNKLEETGKFCTSCGFNNGEEIKPVEKKEEVQVQVNTVPKQKSKAPLVILIVLISLVIIGLLGFVIWLGLNNPKKETKTNTTTNTSTSKKDTPSNNTASGNTATGSVEKKTSSEDMVVGTEEFGYVTLPGTWYKFTDVSGKTALQYTKDSVWIVSIESVNKTSDVTAENLAKTSLYTMKNGVDNVTGATGAKVKVGKYDAYQVYGYYADENIWLVEWFFEPGNGKVHYISVEGNDKYSDYFKIPDTFSLTKED